MTASGKLWQPDTCGCRLWLDPETYEATSFETRCPRHPGPFTAAGVHAENRTKNRIVAGLMEMHPGREVSWQVDAAGAFSFSVSGVDQSVVDDKVAILITGAGGG